MKIANLQIGPISKPHVELKGEVAIPSKAGEYGTRTPAVSVPISRPQYGSFQSRHLLQIPVLPLGEGIRERLTPLYR